MELSVIWYIAAIVANTAVIVLAVYIALLATAYYIERRSRCAVDREHTRSEN